MSFKSLRNINRLVVNNFKISISSPIAFRLFSSYPQHILVPMPSLSPTMETGSIANWNLKEGDKFDVGTAICEVETDKATVTYEATDEGYIARILVGTGEVKVGEPMMITVEEQEDIAAFKSYVVKANTFSSPVIEAPTPVIKAPVAPTSVVPKVEGKKIEAPKPVAQKPVVAAPVIVVAPEAVVNNAVADNESGFNNTRWGTGIVEGALANKLSSNQHVYLEKYGRSSHQPINKK